MTMIKIELQYILENLQMWKKKFLSFEQRKPSYFLCFAADFTVTIRKDLHFLALEADFTVPCLQQFVQFAVQRSDHFRL